MTIHGNLSLSLDSNSYYILHEWPVFLQDQVVPGEGTGRTIRVPVHRESQTLCVQVFQVRFGTDEWKI